MSRQLLAFIAYSVIDTSRRAIEPADHGAVKLAMSQKRQRCRLHAINLSALQAVYIARSR